ncbi:hypothetical protein ACERII_07015 [Evansella sp. AB-rgal1]|uniref:hypothetical protein n=1 Tax=Evansella sp. AB-rgal1 TaxID=3242696 RepID=UPI00359E328F
MNMFGMNKKNNNKNGLMISLVGLGIGAAAYSMMKGRNTNNMNNMMEPIKNVMDQMKNNDNHH